MTSTIVARLNSINELEKLEQTRQYLENCLKKSEEVDQKAELIKFYVELAEVEGISLEHIVKQLNIIVEKASEIKVLISQVKSTKKLKSQAEILINIYKLFTELVKNYWMYLPPKAVESLKALKEEIEKCGGRAGLNCTGSILLVLNRSSDGENLLHAYRKSSLGLANAISDALEQDLEDALDMEVARAAEEEARRKGTVSWELVKAKYRKNN
ncbi:MAG: hypothetical protein VKL60_11870 [Sphaerospermopsis sp.]|nr:hypothetical protein [Sphaerospermopsis sp.]